MPIKGEAGRCFVSIKMGVVELYHSVGGGFFAIKGKGGGLCVSKGEEVN